MRKFFLGFLPWSIPFIILGPVAYCLVLNSPMPVPSLILSPDEILRIQIIRIAQVTTIYISSFFIVLLLFLAVKNNKEKR